MSHLLRQVFRTAAALLATILGGCDAPTSSQGPAGRSASAALVVGENREQSYYLDIESTFHGSPPRSERLIVTRKRVGSVWETQLEILRPVGLSAAVNMDRSVGRIIISADGQRQLFDRKGRKIEKQDGIGVFDGKDVSHPRMADALRRRPKPTGLPAFGRSSLDHLEMLLQPRSRHAARTAAIRRTMGMGRSEPGGKERFFGENSTGATEVVVDSRTGAIVELTERKRGRPPVRISYEFSEVGDRLLRRRSRYTYEGDGSAPASTLIITVSKMKVDGKEIAQ